MIVPLLKDIDISDPCVLEHEYCVITPVSISPSSYDSFLCGWCDSLTADTSCSCSLVMICKTTIMICGYLKILRWMVELLAHSSYFSFLFLL